MSIEFIQATEEDKNYLLSLRKLTMVEHLEKAGLFLSDDEHLFRLCDSYECSHIIIDSGKNVGVLKYRELTDKIEIMQLQIHPNNQGNGLGKRVLNRVIEWSKEKQKIIELTVLKANPAKLLYERLDFSYTGEDEHEFHMQFTP